MVSRYMAQSFLARGDQHNRVAGSRRQGRWVQAIGVKRAVGNEDLNLGEKWLPLPSLTPMCAVIETIKMMFEIIVGFTLSGCVTV